MKKPLILFFLAIAWEQGNAFSALTSSSSSSLPWSSCKSGGIQKGRGGEACIIPATTTDVYKQQQQQATNLHSDHHTFNNNNIPPWLQRYYDESNNRESNSKNGEGYSPVLQKLQELETLLTTSGFSLQDKQDVLQTMFYYCAPSSAVPNKASSATSSSSSSSETALLMGMIDFVHLIVAEHGHFQSLEVAEAEDTDDDACDKEKYNNNSNNIKTPMHCDVFASKPVILAGIAHYAETVLALQNGIYDRLERSLQPSMFPSLSSPPNNINNNNNTPLCKSLPPSLSTTRGRKNEPSPPHQTTTASYEGGSGRFPPNLPESSRKIAASAAAIKRAEILARTIMGVGSTRRLTKEEAEGLQGLLLSSMDDWRALALRCIASLFRLEGILYQQQKELLMSTSSSSSTTSNNNNEHTTTKQHQQDDDDRSVVSSSSSSSSGSLSSPILRSPEVVHTAQEAIMVYGTLAQRLGMHQLKAKIEEKAFQILYQRQYRAVSSVYQQNRNAMQVIRSHLSTQIDALLRNDEALMTHIETLEVSSRVKEPYSFWKKLLKTKAKQKKKRRRKLLSLPASPPPSTAFGQQQPIIDDAKDEDDSRVASNLSFTQVQDGIALRVILKAKKETPDEPDETTRAREKLLCYYVQHLIRKQWPGDEERVKDYIQYPKPNGYQSLHYTAWLTYYTGQHFPFEVQVRSEEMHRIAEYGVAAHWDYKLAAAAGAGRAHENNGKKPAFVLKAASDGNGKNKATTSEDAAMVDFVQGDDHDHDHDDVTQPPEIVVGEMLLSSESVMKASPPSLNGNTLSPMAPTPAAPATAAGIIDSEAAAKYEALLNERNGKNAKGNSQFEYIDALVTAKQTLRQQRVYVFVAGSASLTMEQGQLLVLDSGSSIRDALQYMKQETPDILQPLVEEPIWETSGNFSCRPTGVEFAAEPSIPVWRNGKQAKMDDIVRNGDVLLLEL